MGERELHGSSNFGKCVERRNGVAVFNSGEIAAEEPCPFFDVTLRHSLLQPETPDCYSNIHRKVSVNGNQSSTRWQAKSYDISSNSLVLISLRTTTGAPKRSNGFSQAKISRSTFLAYRKKI